MKYAFEVHTDGSKTVHSFADEFARVEWIGADVTNRGILNGNSKDVKGALYRQSVIPTSLRERVVVQ